MMKWSVNGGKKIVVGWLIIWFGLWNFRDK